VTMCHYYDLLVCDAE